MTSTAYVWPYTGFPWSTGGIYCVFILSVRRLSPASGAREKGYSCWFSGSTVTSTLPKVCWGTDVEASASRMYHSTRKIPVYFRIRYWCWSCPAFRCTSQVQGSDFSHWFQFCNFHNRNSGQRFFCYDKGRWFWPCTLIILHSFHAWSTITGPFPEWMLLFSAYLFIKMRRTTRSITPNTDPTEINTRVQTSGIIIVCCPELFRISNWKNIFNIQTICYLHSFSVLDVLCSATVVVTNVRDSEIFADNGAEFKIQKYKIE